MFILGGHRPDPPNKIYIPFSKSQLTASTLTNSFNKESDLRPFCSPIRNQGQTSSCVSQATIKALEIKLIQKFGFSKFLPLSVADLYYGARDEMDPKETNVDEGTHISIACDVLRRFGVCRESTHPFNQSNIFIPPPILATREARLNRISGHFKIDSIGQQRVNDVILNLAAGNPVVYGTAVGDNWAAYNQYSKPLSKTLNPKGFHATTLLGYKNGWFIGANSWDKTWGFSGFYFIDPAVIADSDASQDFWIIACDFDLCWEKF
jgi:C1A family cysteine protease